MTGLEQFLMIMGIFIGITIGVCSMCLFGFVVEMYTFWQLGRYIAVQVTEKKHKRRVELLAMLIELERAKQPVPSEIPVIESQERVVNELVACQREPWPSSDDQNFRVGK
jgi:hypothetical protein